MNKRCCQFDKCQKEFEPSNSQQLYCSKACSKKQYKNNNPLASNISDAKYRAKKRNLEFNLDLNKIEIPEYCPILGIKLSNDSMDSAYSIDRIDPNGGYTMDNIQIISNRANTLKSNGTLDEFEKLVKWMKKTQNLENS